MVQPHMAPHSSRGFSAGPRGSAALVCGIVTMSLWQSKAVHLLVTGKQKGRSRESQEVKSMSLLVIQKTVSPKRSTISPPPQTTKPSTHDLREDI